ncbi:MAG: phosphotransferase [Chloroflexota bacterium]|nr:phosphotransferase [Chloroflexota bacterium]MDQ5865657.1 phosphotransferase [Chloroflexota bacterium]
MVGDGELEAQFPDVELGAVAGVARQALGSSTAILTNWRMETVGADMGPATGGVYRVAGSALEDGLELSWSAVLKIVSLGAPEANSPFSDEAHPLYWKREALAYTSGLLDDLPGGIAAPRCYGAIEQEGGAVWLWLEEVKDSGTRKWGLEQYAHAARCLGRFNGAYLAAHPMASYSWLVRTGSPRGVLEHNAWVRDVIADAGTWEHPLTRSAFPVPVVEPLLKLWDGRKVLLGALDRVPQTFCHLDAWRRNMFVRVDVDGTAGLTLIDWAYPGFGAIGTDAGDLFGESFCLAELGDTEASVLDEAIFGGYLEGLREAGGAGDADEVRFAFAAFCALKHVFMIFISVRGVQGSSRQAAWERLFGRSFDEFIHRQSRLLYYLLDLSDEAYRLE